MATPKKKARKKAPAPAPRAKSTATDSRAQKLVQAIIDGPDDEGPRLVYADWLMEQGDPRGEFILIQCALGRPLHGASGYVLENDPDAKQPLSREELEQREKKLLKQHQKEWVAPFRESIRTWSWKWGFVNGVIADAAKFLKGCAGVFANTPLTELELTAAKPKLLEELAALPELSRITTLKLGQQRIDAKAAQFFCTPNVSGVRLLDIWGNPLGEEGTKILAQAQHLDSLRELNLSTTKQTLAGLDALSRSKFFPQLTHLTLDHNDNLDSSIGAMLARGKSLTHLELARCNLGEDGLEALAPGVPNLEEVALFGCKIGEHGADLLCSSAHFKKLRSVQGLVGYYSEIKDKSKAAERLRKRFGEGLQ